MSEARTELHRRFDYLDYNQQKKILLAHLKSSMSDRQWAYPRLLDYWDDSFTVSVKELWEKFYEERLFVGDALGLAYADKEADSQAQDHLFNARANGKGDLMV